MTKINSPPLALLIHTLTRRSQIGTAEAEAVLGLPSRLVRHDAGAYLFREGERVASCILIRSGFAYQSKVSGTGARQIVALHLRGDFVGLKHDLLAEADHNVQALTPVEAAHIPHQAIMDLAEAHPAIARSLWRESLVESSMYRESILNIGRRDARQRISHMLCELALRQEVAGLCKGPDYEWPMTQEQIGDATGLTSVHVNRTVQSMRRDGIIRLSKHILTVKDWQRLQDEGDFRRAYLHLPAPATTNPAAIPVHG